jgi:kynurenine formamidase
VKENDMADVPSLMEFLGEDTPSNWGKWGPDDELGALNVLGPVEALNGVQQVVTGEVFTLQSHWGRQSSPGDLIWMDRTGIERKNVLDESCWDPEVNTGPNCPGGIRWSDDVAKLHIQGTTHYDAVGHVWYDGKIWNGYSARETVGEMHKASILPMAEKGIVGRAVLIDMARRRGKPWLDADEEITLDELLECALHQGVEIQPRDIVVIRTGWMAYWYHFNDPAKFYENYSEPGLAYSRELVEWFQTQEIPNLISDTIGNEASFHKESGVASPLHAALIRDLGVAFTELAWLEDLAEACAKDNRWTFLYTAGPLKIVGATGGPVNPVAIR